MATDTNQDHGSPRVEIAPFDPEVARALEELADHFNADHEDTVTLMALGGGAPADIGGAAIAAVTPTGIELDTRTPDHGSRRLRLTFDSASHDVDGVRAHVFTLLTRARAAVGDAMPVTSIEAELAATKDLRTFVTTVTAVADLTPGMRQITVGGGLEGFEPIGPDQFLYLITAMPGGGPVVPGLTMAQVQEAPADQRPSAAYYTVRAWRPAVTELDLWVVLHDHDEGVAGWAARVTPGDRVALWGPRSAYAPPETTTSLLLVGDETALPAIAAILEQRAPEQPATVVVEAADEAHAVQLPVGPGVAVHWVFRDGEPAGTGTRLLDTVRGLDLDRDGLYAFGAAEARQIAQIRRHLRQDRELTAAQVRMTGYWRRR